MSVSQIKLKHMNKSQIASTFGTELKQIWINDKQTQLRHYNSLKKLLQTEITPQLTTKASEISANGNIIHNFPQSK